MTGLLAPAPIRTRCDVSVAAFGPRRVNLDPTPVATLASLEAYLQVSSTPPPPDALPLHPMRSVSWSSQSWVLEDGLPRAVVGPGLVPVVGVSGTPYDPHDSDVPPTEVFLGESARFVPADAVTVLNTSSYRRHPGGKLRQRTTQEVSTWTGVVGDPPAAVPSAVLSGALPGPKRVTDLAYWRGDNAQAPAVVFRPTSTELEALTAQPAAWRTGRSHFTVVMVAVLRESGDLWSPLLECYVPLFGVIPIPSLGLRFSMDGTLRLYEPLSAWSWVVSGLDLVFTPLQATPTQSYSLSLSLLDDVRRANQPVVIGLRLDHETREACIVACDVRVHLVKGRIKTAVPEEAVLMVGGDSDATTGPGAFDLLDMRWTFDELDDLALTGMVSALAEMWGVTS